LKLPWKQFAFSLAIGAVVINLVGCTASPKFRRDEAGRPPARQAPSGEPYQIGFASYYGSEFHGRRTSSGEVYDMNALTAAHNTLPLGTIIKVTNLSNHRSVLVKVNDRGPFKPGRILDLSFGAARQLGMVRNGTARVRIEILELGEDDGR